MDVFLEKFEQGGIEFEVKVDRDLSDDSDYYLVSFTESDDNAFIESFKIVKSRYKGCKIFGATFSATGSAFIQFTLKKGGE